VATRMYSISGPSGYQLLPLREGADFALYRGRQHGNPSPILVVALTAEQPRPQDIRRLEHEYSLANKLDSRWAAKPLTLSQHQGKTILILEDSGGEPLDRILQQHQGQPLDLTRFLRIAIGLATALGQVHRHDLIHKDIKPENVLVHDTGKVWLTGFGIASRLPQEHQTPAPPEILAGTLPYMAPEQTGRMNHSIDTRSDLYSLGVTLYEMLTGQLPFVARDAMEWVHCHIAREPMPPNRRAQVPTQLSRIVMHLLAKAVEERYQTAMGLEIDLRRCLEEWETKGSIGEFQLGTNDIPNRLLIPAKLYGREHELDAMLGAFDRVVTHGTPEIVLVSGYSGVGKSSIVNELHKVLVPPRGLFAAGKFDQYKRDIPYATLAQVFKTLVRQILVKNEAEVNHWRDALRDALGLNGQLIINLIPELEFIIGRQAPVADLPPRDAQNRFHLVFQRFLGVFAKQEHPLALFLDDLQWVDAATLELLQHLITRSEMGYVLLVGAYRDNEVCPSHPLPRTLKEIRKAGPLVQEIVLKPLGLDDVGALVSDALHCDAKRALPLAQLVQEKTGGNPFFAIQFFTALTEEGVLSFDPVTQAWQWDMNQIQAKSYTDNVVDLMSDKLRRLSNATQSALKYLACLGNVSDIARLVFLQNETEVAMRTALWEAVRAGLIFHQENTYKFLHDRIQQASYSLIPEAQRAEVHLHIGRKLFSGMTEDDFTEHLFDVANQLNRGVELLIDHDEKIQVAKINLRAGRKAKASAAYVAAGAYFSVGMALLDELDWDTKHELTFSLWRERAECELLTGNLDKAEQLIGELLERRMPKVDQSAIYRLKIQLHEVKGEYPQAVATGLRCLKLFGIDIPAHPSPEQVQSEYETVWQALNGRTIESLIDLPLMTDPEAQAAMQVFASLNPAATLADFGLGCFQICRMVKIGMEHGTSGAAALACGYFGAILGPVFHRYTDGYRFAKLASDLVERHGFIACKAKICHLMGHVAVWTQPIAIAIEFMRATSRTAIEMGDLVFACYGLVPPIAGSLLRNDQLDAVWRESEIALNFARKAKYRDVIDIIRSQQRFIATMQGRSETFSTFNDVQFDEASFEAQMTADRMALMIFWYWVLKLKARFLAGNYAEALAAGDAAKLQLWSSSALINKLDYVYYFALTVTACYENASTDQRQAWRELLTANLEQLREWAEINPPTFADKHALVSAEIARVDGRDIDAMHLYEQAIQLAREQAFVQNEALSNELAARFYLARGFETIAVTYLRNARNCYDCWGAVGKVRQLDERYPRLYKERHSHSSTATVSTSVGQLDIETVVKASQTLSSEIVLPKLIEKLMRIALEHAGAERGLLILLEDNEPRIEAEAVTGLGRINVAVRPAAIMPSDLPLSALHYVIRTREPVVLDDASLGSLYSEDEYVRQTCTRSVLCLPIVKQSKLVGALYMENKLTPRVFTSERVGVLELLASQAAISIENANLYSDLRRSYSDLHRSEAFLIQGQGLSHTGSFGWNVSSGAGYWSEETYHIFEQGPSFKPTWDLVLQQVHPDDRDFVQQVVEDAARDGKDFDVKYRINIPNGSIKHVHAIARASNSSEGNLEYVGAVTDVTAAKQAEDKIRQSEMELRQILDFAPQCVAVLGPDRDRARLYTNQTMLDYFGFTLDEWRSSDRRKYYHPDDWERLTSETQSKFLSGVPHEYEARFLGKDGKYRWFLFRWNPLRDEQGRVTRWYAAATDIDDRKQAEQRLQHENVALREEIDKASMFEEIVGTSPPLQAVLSRISKVAPTDSTVLITGETGTGKELVARAIHRRSRRSSHGFVSVNCAAIPRELIASELFGHEKGSFTGANQRRLGRFELAEGGSIFLDEVGELPSETQIALLRVLQEHEFERVGGTVSIATDVRVIAATNRDLEAAIAAGAFRSDLYYRLNVFPIAMPALRERSEDIPLLVEYFIDRFARKTGKSFQAVSKKSLDLLQSYPWPGNIRELQNVIERSVIVCEAENFSVDESWLSRQPLPIESAKEPGLFKKLHSQEKAIIEAALSECGGRVYGPFGAASRLGMPRSTLESKIRSLKIDKDRFKNL
jgi:PAS domain S-box-containing protein